MSQLVSRIGRHFAGGIAVAAFATALVGCESHQVTRDLAIVATNADTGLPVDGVRIAQHVEGGWLQGLADDALVTTGEDGRASLAASRRDASWLVVRSGFEPMVVEFGNGSATSPDTEATMTRIDWNSVVETGMLELEMTPMRSKSMRITVIDADTGAVVPHATVEHCSTSYLDQEIARTLFGVPVAITTTADREGHAVIEVPAGMETVIRVTAAGRIGSEFRLDPRRSTGVPAEMSVAIAEPHYEPTRVIVLDRRTGAPVGGVDLIVGLHDPTTGALRSTGVWTTDVEGLALLMKPGAGLGTIEIRAGDRHPDEFRLVEVRSPDLPAIVIEADAFD
ncbi:MAG: hypothetical protein CMJ22_06715 [Phycisphaerae bacterium]|nr:hypothetical protein [Phycisphaerae bacterium]